MQVHIILSFLAVVILCQEKKVSRLQIGIKKRPDKCDMKTKKGDVVHVHYTVSCNKKNFELVILCSCSKNNYQSLE